MIHLKNIVSDTHAGREDQSAMMPSLIRLLVLVCLGSSIIIAMLPLADTVRSGSIWSPAFLAKASVLICLAFIVTAAFYFVLKNLARFIDANAKAQAHFLDALDPRHVDVAILFSAALSLFLELGIIRWQSTVFPF